MFGMPFCIGNLRPVSGHTSSPSITSTWVRIAWIEWYEDTQFREIQYRLWPLFGSEQHLVSDMRMHTLQNMAHPMTFTLVRTCSEWYEDPQFTLPGWDHERYEDAYFTETQHPLWLLLWSDQHLVSDMKIHNLQKTQHPARLLPWSEQHKASNIKMSIIWLLPLWQQHKSEQYEDVSLQIWLVP